MAIVWDYLDKLRLLEATGDRPAQAALKEWNNAWETDNRDKLVELERTVLKKASEDFALLSPLEKKDLERLFADRNHCAHPSYSRPDEIFEPSAELARVHVRNAVEHLMQHPPVQGRAAHDRVLSEVESNYFPTSSKAAQQWLQAGPLARPRDTLVNSIFAVLVKDVLVENFDAARRNRTFAALQAVKVMHGTLVETYWRDKLGGVLHRVDDAGLWRGVEFLSVFPETWDIWPTNCQVRWQTYMKAVPTLDLARVLPLAMRCAPFREAAATAFASYGDNEVKQVLDEGSLDNPAQMPLDVLRRAFEAYAKAGSWEEAKSWASRLSRYSSAYSSELLREFIPQLASNSQVRTDWEFPGFLSAARGAEVLPFEEFDTLCSVNGLQRLVRQWNPQFEDAEPKVAAANGSGEADSIL